MFVRKDHNHSIACRLWVPFLLIASAWPALLNGQSPSYQLSTETDSIITLLTSDISLQEVNKVIDNMGNAEGLIEAEKVKSQLALANGDERKELALNMRLGRYVK